MLWSKQSKALVCIPHHTNKAIQNGWMALDPIGCVVVGVGGNIGAPCPFPVAWAEPTVVAEHLQRIGENEVDPLIAPFIYERL